MYGVSHGSPLDVRFQISDLVESYISKQYRQNENLLLNILDSVLGVGFLRFRSRGVAVEIFFFEDLKVKQNI